MAARACFFVMSFSARSFCCCCVVKDLAFASVVFVVSGLAAIAGDAVAAVVAVTVACTVVGVLAVVGIVAVVATGTVVITILDVAWLLSTTWSRKHVVFWSTTLSRVAPGHFWLACRSTFLLILMICWQEEHTKPFSGGPVKAMGVRLSSSHFSCSLFCFGRMAWRISAWFLFRCGWRDSLFSETWQARQ